MRGTSTRFDVALALALDARHGEFVCPALEDVVAWHEGALDAAAAERLAGHVAHCDACYGHWQALLDLVPAASSRRRPWRAPVAMAAAAAVIFVFATWMTRPPATLPPYAMQVREGSTLRGDGEWIATQSVTLPHTAPLSVLLTPASRPEAPVDAAVYRLGDGSPEPLAGARVEVGAAGGIRIEVPVGSTLGSGTHRLAVVVGYAGALPDEELLHAARGLEEARNWTALGLLVVVTP